jgi:Transposase DNA-binding
MQELWEKNFSYCALGDYRLSKRAQQIGKTLVEGFGKSLSEAFKNGNDLKRAYEFLPILEVNLAR